MHEQLTKYFEEVKDPRSARNQKHKFITIIGTTILAMLCGVDSFSGIQDFVESHIEELSKHFEFPQGVASHDTYQRFWDAISPTQFLESFYEFVDSIKKVRGDTISIDGKTIRNSGKGKPLHIVSAWCEANQLVLAQEKVDVKSNEITAIPKILKLLDLEGRTVTIDAMGAQRNICEQIIEQKGNYIIGLKGNQGTLHREVIQHLDEIDNQEFINENYDKGHGRIERRKATVSHNIDAIQKQHKWPGLKSVGKIESEVIRKNKTYNETRYFISSEELRAEQLNAAARSHWGIENRLHWRLDVVFNEDKGCIRNDNAAENMDILRKWALNILRQAKTKPDQSIKSIMRKNAMNFQHLCSTVNKIIRA